MTLFIHFFIQWITLNLLTGYQKKKKARLIVHVADHCVSFFKNPVFEKIIKNSYRRACIGVNMQESYEQRFNIPFKVFHNYADNKHLPLKSITPSMFSDTYPLKILFIGSIFENLHQGSIQDLCSVIRKMNSEGKPIIFEFYGQMQPTDYLKKEIDNISIFHRGKINPEEVDFGLWNNIMFLWFLLLSIKLFQSTILYPSQQNFRNYLPVEDLLSSMVQTQWKQIDFVSNWKLEY